MVVEPSAAAALESIRRVSEEGEPFGAAPENITHMAWLTGGGMLPEEVRARYVA